MNRTSYETTRAELFAHLKALFEFDANGVLPCLAPGMSGPLAIPLGYLDLTDVVLNGKRIGAVLVLTWTNAESAKLHRANIPVGEHGSGGRDATNEELRCALEHYQRAVQEYRETVLRCCVPAGEEAPLWLQKRLGMAPFFTQAANAVQ
jgi:hypothetical protein